MMTYKDTDAEGKFVIGMADEFTKLRAENETLHQRIALGDAKVVELTMANERLTGALENIRDYAGGTGQSHIAALAHVALMASLVAQSAGEKT